MPYTPGGYPYDGTVLGTEKQDGDELSATEYNTQLTGTANAANAIISGDFHGCRDMDGGMPDVAPSGEMRWTARAGRAVVSRGGKAFWDPFTRINVLEYDADPTGDTDCTQAILNAIAAMPRGVSGHNGTILEIPAGDYLIGSGAAEPPFNLSGMQGFWVTGAGGGRVTRLIWNGSAGLDFIYVMGSQLWGLERLTLWGKAAARPSAMIHLRMEAGYQFAQYGVSLYDIDIDGLSQEEEFDFGIRTSTDGQGNNSEVKYRNVKVFGAKEACAQISGTQAKGHIFDNCLFTNSERGVYCKDEGDGSTGIKWFGGTMAHMSEACFSFEYPGEPIVIRDGDFETNKRFFTFGSALNSTGQPVSITDNRIDSSQYVGGAEFDTFIQTNLAGPFEFKRNTLTCGDAGVPRIAVYSGGSTCSMEIVGNYFLSDNSVETSPLNWDEPDEALAQSVGPAYMVELKRNVYIRGTDGAERVARMEPLDWHIPEDDVFVLENCAPDNWYTLRVAIGQFNAAAVKQTKSFTLPKGTAIQGFGLYQNGQIVISGNTATVVNCRIGSASDGDEFIEDTDVTASDTVLLGGATQGALMAAPDYQPGLGYMPQANYFSDVTVYVTLESTSGNLGNGSVSNLTGDLHILLKAVRAPRRYRVA